MAYDHYVAQTYLKHFQVHGTNRCVNAIRKKNLSELVSVPTHSICGDANWNTSPFHEDPQVIEEYLKIYEPHWDKCIATLHAGEFNKEIKGIMSGYISYLRSCTKTSVRLAKEPLHSVVSETYKLIEKRALQSQSEHTEAIKAIQAHGGLDISIDQDFAKGMVFQGVVKLAEKLNHSRWQLVENKGSSSFLTSDNPLIILWFPGMINYFYMPLSPRLAVLIYPHILASKERPDELCRMGEKGVSDLNRQLVRGAEDLVIFNMVNQPWVKNLVKRNQNWRVENTTVKIPSGKGTLHISQHIISEYETSARS